MKFYSRRLADSLLLAILGLTQQKLNAKVLEAQERVQHGPLKQAIMGALLFLDDQQIRQRQGFGDPRFDACSGDGCWPTLPGTGTALPLPLPFVKNRSGEWANFIHIYPNILGAASKEKNSLLEIQDSNLFMTAGIAYPLYLFDEAGLDRRTPRTVEQLRQSSVGSFEQYRRQEAFSFWPLLPGSTSSTPRVGPLNIPMLIGYGQNISKILPFKPKLPNPLFQEWMDDVGDRKMNPYGLDALANIPSDADDTALAISLRTVARDLDGQSYSGSDEALQMLLAYRDQDRSLEDSRDNWKGKDTGAFLTWLKDENLSREERFKSPETGVIPLAVNNVDCIVNANVLLSFGLLGRSDEPAVLQTSQLLRKAVERRTWPACGLYYPQRMMFPYVLTRAFRDGRILNDDMQKAVEQLLFDLLAEQKDMARQSPKLKGAFSGGTDSSFDLSTALAVTSLLNIGPEIPESLGVSADYRQAIQDGIDYLLKSARPTRLQFASTFNSSFEYPHYPLPFDKALSWQAGVFFSASNWNLAQWRSQAYSTAIVLESLGKYLLGYDLEPGNFISGRRIKVLHYARNIKHAAEDFDFVLE